MSERTTSSSSRPRSGYLPGDPWPLTEDELQLIADVSGVPVEKLRVIVGLVVKAVHEKGGYVLTGGKMVKASNASAAWNVPVDISESAT